MSESCGFGNCRALGQTTPKSPYLPTFTKSYNFCCPFTVIKTAWPWDIAILVSILEGYKQYFRGNHWYSGGYSVQWRETTDTFGITSTVLAVSLYRTEYPPQYRYYPSKVFIVSLMVSHSTDGRIPPQY